MKRIFLIAPLEDGQTGWYVYEAFKELGWAVAVYDMRAIGKMIGMENLGQHMIKNLESLDPKPDLMLVLKGTEVPAEPIDYARSKGIHTACWIYDATLNGTPMPECTAYRDLVNHYDVFYSYCDNIDDLKKAGFKNPVFLAEGYSEKYNGEAILNYYLSQKFGSDLAFIGSMDDIHPCRQDFLNRIIDEGFDIKIYGEIKVPVSKQIQSKHQGYAVINEYHAYVNQSSKINLGGFDSDYMVNRSHSARVYRTLAAGGFYLCRRTGQIEKDFTPGVHLDVFDTDDEMIEKITYYLNHPEERARIAKAGQKKVKEYQFINRIEKEFGRGEDE